MTWHVQRLNSTPPEYLEVDNDGFYAWTTSLGSSLKFEDKSSSDQIIRVLVDSGTSVQDP